MGKVISIALFVLLAEACQFYLYAYVATGDLARVGLLGPLAGAMAGVGVATLLEQLWPGLDPFYRSVLYVSIVVVFISAGTTYYQCYAEQITHDARLLRPHATYAAGRWGGDPWMMYPGLGNEGFGTGCQYMWHDLGASVMSTLVGSIAWLPVVFSIAWLTKKNAVAPRVEARDAVMA